MEGAISASFTNKRIAVVTGGNKGIGLAVCRQLAGSGGVAVVLTARDEARGAAAAKKLRGEGLPDVVFHQLDITDAASIARLADFLKARFGRLDILVNNAGIGGVELLQDPSLTQMPTDEMFNGMDALQRFEWMCTSCQQTYDAAKECLQTNYYGTKHVTEGLLPLLLSSSDGRIVNLGSDFGLLREFSSDELKRELNDVGKLTEKRLDELLGEFLRDFEGGVDAVAARGWPVLFSAYRVGKAAVHAHARILAKRHPSSLRVNCVEPGYVSTDLTGHSGLLTPDEGAANVVSLALLPPGGPTGAFFNQGTLTSFE